MEVHAHAHPHGKKWTHYLWEFIMLFLAVFCGFMAENIREHKVESNRAKDLAGSFYKELKNDSVAIGIKVQNRIKQENALMSLANYFKDSSLEHVSKSFVLNFMYGIVFRTPALFEPRTVILEQLKNSGSLRYFKNEELQNLIGDISVAITNINDRQNLENQVRAQYFYPLMLKHYDYDFEIQLRKSRELDIFAATILYENSNETIPFHFKSIEKLDRQEIVNLMSFYGLSALESTRRIHYQRYLVLNAELLKVLRKEYHLK